MWRLMQMNYTHCDILQFLSKRSKYCVKAEEIEIECKNCNLLWIEKDMTGLNCFTDSGVSYLETKYTISLHFEPGRAHYWCSGFSIFDMKLIESEKVLTERNSQDYQEFAFYVKMNARNKDNIMQFDNEIKRNFMGSQLSSVKHVRIFEILDEMEENVVVLSHLISDKDTSIRKIDSFLSVIFRDELINTT